MVRYLMTRQARLIFWGLMAAISLILTAPATAQVTFEGTQAASAHSLSAWYDQHIPLRFRATSPLNVRELSNAEMDAYLQQGNSDASHSDNGETGDIDGVFENNPDRLALRLPDDGNMEVFTFAHEYGHYVWFHLFTGDDRKRYDSVYRRQHASGHLVTRYAATDLEEGFAEAFSFYVCEGPILHHRDPASYQFLNQWQTAVRHGMTE